MSLPFMGWVFEFGNEKIVPNAGLLPVVGLLDELRFGELSDSVIDTSLGGRVSNALESLALSFLAGGNHICHVDNLRSGSFKQAVDSVSGFSLLSGSRVGEYLRDIDPVLVEKVLISVQREMWNHREPFNNGDRFAVVDVDSTYCDVHGDKEKCGVNRFNDKCFNPLIGTVGNEIVGYQLRSGNDNHKGNTEFIVNCLTQAIPYRGVKYVLLRADSGFWNWHVVRVCEERGVDYLIKGRKHGGIKKIIAGLDDWERLTGSDNAGIESAEFTYNGQGRDGSAKDLSCRVIVTRRKVGEVNGQIEAFDRYEYQTFHTNVYAMSHSEIIDLYNKRVRIELVIKTFKEMTQGHNPSCSFDANQIWGLVAALAHNINIWVQRLCGPMKWLTNRSMRYFYWATPAVMIRHAKQKKLDFPTNWSHKNRYQTLCHKIGHLQV